VRGSSRPLRTLGPAILEPEVEQKRTVSIVVDDNSVREGAMGLARARLRSGPVIACALILASVLELLACATSPATLALPPDFAVMTTGGVAGVSIREALPGTTEAQFSQLVRTGMEQAAPGHVLAGPLDPPYPELRIVWHVNPTASRGASRLVVNAFVGATRYAHEQETVADDAPTGTVASAVDAMSTRLLATMEAYATPPLPIRP
jgi:hypothetical protein